MKRWVCILLGACLAAFLAGCGGQPQPESPPPVETLAAPEKTQPAPIYPADIPNGTYEISVESSSSMFRVIHCTLVVEDNAMHAVMTMSGDGYGLLYMGTGEEALQASEETYIPFALDEAGKKTFTVPVPALNQTLDCAAWSIRKERWYDRTLVFRGGLLADGTYNVAVTLSGGSGRASVTSPTQVTRQGDRLTATVVWSSPHYEYMVVDGVQYLPEQSDGGARFEIPIVLDEDMAVSAMTSAMSQPHLIDYTLRFQSEGAERVAP